MARHKYGTHSAKHHRPNGWLTTLSWLAAAVLLYGTAARAGVDGTAGAGFLKLGAGARAAALGGTYVGIADDVYAARWNPAGLAQLTSFQAAAQHLSEFGGITHQYVALAIPYGPRLTLGADFIATTATDNYRTELADLNSFSNQDLALGLSAAWAVYPKVAVGITGRYLNERLANVTARGWAVDLGLMYRPSHQWSFGLAALNLGPQITFVSHAANLPMVVKGGVAYHWTPDLLLAADISFPNDARAYFSGGIEYQLTDYLALRTGYEMGSDFRGMDALSAGLAFSYQGLTFDYAFVPRGELGNTHRLGLRVALDVFDRANPLLPAEPAAAATYSALPPSRPALSTSMPNPRPVPAAAPTPVRPAPQPAPVATSQPARWPLMVVVPSPTGAATMPAPQQMRKMWLTFDELCLLGRERMTAGDYPDAIIVFDAANHLQFDNYEAHNALSSAYYALRRYEDCLREQELARFFLNRQ